MSAIRTGPVKPVISGLDPATQPASTVPVHMPKTVVNVSQLPRCMMKPVSATVMITTMETTVATTRDHATLSVEHATDQKPAIVTSVSTMLHGIAL